MKEYICIKKCYYGERLWDPDDPSERGKTLKAEDDFKHRCFKEFDPDEDINEDDSSVSGDEVLFAKIKSVLMQFDVTKDEQWTSDGRPAMKELCKLLGFVTIRTDVEKAWPGFTREMNMKPISKHKVQFMD